jgi:acyl-CoA dehydrogenase
VSVDPVLLETVERLLSDVCPFDEIGRSEGDGWSKSTWAALADSGLAWVGIDEQAGGSGGSLADLAAIVSAVGRHAAPVPLAETAMLGGWLLASAGLPIPAGPLTAIERASITTTSNGRRLLALDAGAAWARCAERIVGCVPVDDGSLVFSLDPAQLSIVAGANLAGEARDHVRASLDLTDVEHAVVQIADLAVELRARGALSRVVMAAGALATMSQTTVDYTNARRQFGKPVSTFQAVQQHLVTAAQSAVRAQMAADVAVRALAAGSPGIEIAAARIVTDDAIALGTRAAHQAHGAMGVTREYPLHQLTRRLWSWRHEWGTTREWRRRLGAAALATPSDRLFLTFTE